MDNIEIIKNRWNEILDYIVNEFELTTVSHDTWLLPMIPVRCTDHRLYIQVDNAFTQRYVQKQFSNFFRVALKEITDLDLEPRFVLENEEEPESEKEEEEKTPEQLISLKHMNLNPKYTFDSFVSGKSNELAHAASLAVAENPGGDYKILYLYGGSGLGKTHLMNAIANYVLKRAPNTNVLYVTSETFTNEFIDAIRRNTTQSFREKYRSQKILLIDDIQFIANKDAVQEEFFHTFNALYEANAQIVITSDKPPREINNLEERIKSRFNGGLVIDIQPPNYETRMAILRKKEEIEGYSVDDEVIKYIAENVKTNIRDLEGALNTVVFRSRLENVPIDIDMAAATLITIIPSELNSHAITIEKIISVVAEHFSLSNADLSSARKNKELTYPRQIAMYLCRELTDSSLKQIGISLGGRDHSTIIHGRDKIAKDIRTDGRVKSDVNILIKKLKI